MLIGTNLRKLKKVIKVQQVKRKLISPKPDPFIWLGRNSLLQSVTEIHFSDIQRDQDWTEGDD